MVNNVIKTTNLLEFFYSVFRQTQDEHALIVLRDRCDDLSLPGFRVQQNGQDQSKDSMG